MTETSKAPGTSTSTSTSTSTDILESLLVSQHRLTRIAAQATGSTTPAAVWRTLSILATDGPMRIGELAAASRISQPALSKFLPTLTGDELVHRIADVDDSRAWLITISPRGAAALENWRRELASTLEPLFDDLSTDEWNALAAAAEILQRKLHTSAPRTITKKVTKKEEAAA